MSFGFTILIERCDLLIRYMTTEMEGQQSTKVDINEGPDLGGVADLFG